MMPLRRLVRLMGLSFLYAMGVALCLWAQTGGGITTIAGTGIYGLSGDQGPATAARLDTAQALAIDAQGAVYIADLWNHRVRKFTPGGSITTVAGTGEAGYAGDGGSAALARLAWPRGLAVDSQGNLYIADTGNSRVRKIVPGGTISTVAGTGEAGYAGDGGQATAAKLNGPRGLAVDAKGNLYIGDGWNFRVRRVAPDGTISTIAGTGVHGASGDAGPASGAQVGVVQSIAVDAQGNLFLADVYNHRVRKIAPSGSITTVAGGYGYGSGGDGGAAESSQLSYPKGLAVDNQGNLFIADAQNHRIRKVTPKGTVSTVAGIGVKGFSGDSGPASCAQLQYPFGIAVDPQGALVIADLRNYRVRKAAIAEVTTRPIVPAAALVSAASGRGPLAPGSLVSIYGQWLAAATCSATALPLSASLGGASVLVGGKPLPLVYVSAAQINAQLPADVPAGRASASVTCGGLLSDSIDFDVVASAPALFQVGQNRGAILNQDYSLNTADKPAARGSAVIIYATGQGQVTPAVTDGEPAGADPLSVTPTNPTVTIGGVAAPVLFSGLAPGFVGLWQVNATVPATAPTGSSVPVRLTMGSVASSEVTMAVR
jgi:uncharacterized protein (TIGR03437 family)